MRRFPVLFLFLFYSTVPSLSQGPEKLKPVSAGKKYSVSAGVKIPVGNFFQTHSIGFGAALERAPVFYNTKAGKFNFTYNGGVSFFNGKKETVSGYDYQYLSYLFFHVFGGFAYNLSATTNLSFTAGPGLGLYNKTTRFNLASLLNANYFFSNKYGAGAGLLLLKENKADPLLSVTLNGIILF